MGRDTAQKRGNLAKIPGVWGKKGGRRASWMPSSTLCGVSSPYTMSSSQDLSHGCTWHHLGPSPEILASLVWVQPGFQELLKLLLLIIPLEAKYLLGCHISMSVSFSDSPGVCSEITVALFTSGLALPLTFSEAFTISKNFIHFPLLILSSF